MDLVRGPLGGSSELMILMPVAGINQDEHATRSLRTHKLRNRKQHKNIKITNLWRNASWPMHVTEMYVQMTRKGAIINNNAQN